MQLSPITRFGVGLFVALAGVVVAVPSATATAATRSHIATTAHATPPTSLDVRYGIVPLRRGGVATPAPGALGPNSLPCEVTCSSIHLTYNGGPIISTMKVEDVFWGTGTYTTGGGPGESMPAFFNAIGSSDYWKWLTEYNANIPYSGGQGTNQVVGQASSLGEATISPSAPNNGSTITDAEMQTELALQLNAGHLPAPVLDSHGGVETNYALFFPTGKTLCLSAGQCNTNTFCAYHGTMTYQGHDVPYMVLPPFTVGSPEAAGCGTLPTLFNDFTSVVSHETVETETDTGVGLATDFAPPLGWYDATNNAEIADVCETGQNQSSSLIGGYYVQAEWSNVAGACIFTRPFVDLSPAEASIPAGSSQAYTASGSGGADLTGSTTFSISPNGGSTGASCTGSSCTASLAGAYTVTGSSGGVSGDKVNLTVTTAQCQPGYYSATGLAPCTAAPAGSYVSTTGATSPTPCAKGTYNPVTAATSCPNAPAGTYVASTGAISPTNCPAGTYNPNTGSTSSAACISAPPGSYVPSPGSSAPTQCAAGSYSASSGATSCTLADPGHYVGSPGSTGQTQCAAGSYSASSGATSCTLADPGHYVGSPGSTGQTQCAAGSYSASSGATSCTLADPGHYVGSPGSTGQTQCAAGSYSASSGATSCTLADPGHYVGSPGSTSQTQCAAGSYSASSGATSCTLAAAGHYVGGPGSTSQTPCAAGSYSASSGATSCTLAAAGHYVGGPGSTSQTPCAAGAYAASTGTVACTLAPAGSYVGSTCATAPAKCAIGSYGPSTGLVKCLLAPLNTYVATVGAIATTACPVKTFTLKVGSTSKAACVALAITTTSLPAGRLYSVVKVRYSTKLMAKGGVTPYSWTLGRGSALPPGLVLGKASGVISGRPTKVGTFSFTVKVAASGGKLTAKRLLSITITK